MASWGWNREREPWRASPHAQPLPCPCPPWLHSGGRGHVATASRQLCSLRTVLSSKEKRSKSKVVLVTLKWPVSSIRLTICKVGLVGSGTELEARAQAWGWRAQYLLQHVALAQGHQPPVQLHQLVRVSLSTSVAMGRGTRGQPSSRPHPHPRPQRPRHPHLVVGRLLQNLFRFAAGLGAPPAGHLRGPQTCELQHGPRHPPGWPPSPAQSLAPLTLLLGGGGFWGGGGGSRPGRQESALLSLSLSLKLSLEGGGVRRS